MKFQHNNKVTRPRWVSFIVDLLPFRDHVRWFKETPNQITAHEYLKGKQSIRKLIEWADKNDVDFTIEGSDYHDDTVFSIIYKFTPEQIESYKKQYKKSRKSN